MLVEEYREVQELSNKELKRLRSYLGEDVLLIGGWAAHMLANEGFKEWKDIDYIGSIDIDFAVRSAALSKVSEALLKTGYRQINFRFYKIFERSSMGEISDSAARARPMYDLIYLYVDLVLDKKVNDEAFFSDDLIGVCFERKLWIEQDGYRVIRPEPLLVIKVSILGMRNEDKRVKDMLDCLFVGSFAKIDRQLVRDLAQIRKVRKSDINVAKRMLKNKSLDAALLALRLDSNEIATMKTTFLSLLELMA